jgi:hypothetical protein
LFINRIIVVSEDEIVKKKVTFEKRNPDPQYFCSTIYANFPALGDQAFNLWRMEKDNPLLIPLEARIDNAVALCEFVDLNRSHLYIKPLVGILQFCCLHRFYIHYLVYFFAG